MAASQAFCEMSYWVGLSSQFSLCVAMCSAQLTQLPKCLLLNCNTGTEELVYSIGDLCPLHLSLQHQPVSLSFSYFIVVHLSHVEERERERQY